MVDAKPLVLLPGAGLIIPERVEPAFVRRRAQRVGVAEIDQALIGGAGLRQKQRVADPRGRLVDVARAPG